MKVKEERKHKKEEKKHKNTGRYERKRRNTFKRCLI
jgi:hypothetical protein